MSNSSNNNDTIESVQNHLQCSILKASAHIYSSFQITLLTSWSAHRQDYVNVITMRLISLIITKDKWNYRSKCRITYKEKSMSVITKFTECICWTLQIEKFTMSFWKCTVTMLIQMIMITASFEIWEKNIVIFIRTETQTECW